MKNLNVELILEEMLQEIEKTEELLHLRSILEKVDK